MRYVVEYEVGRSRSGEGCCGIRWDENHMARFETGGVVIAVLPAMLSDGMGPNKMGRDGSRAIAQSYQHECIQHRG